MTSQLLEHRETLDRWMRGCLGTGAMAAVACIIGAFFSPAEFFRSYMYSYLYVLGLPLGSLVLVMIHYLTGGAWGLLIRRIAEAQMKTLPVIALLFVPICIGLPYIFLWADPSVATAEKHQLVQSYYLQPWFFYLRATIYFAAWLILAFFFSLWSRRQDESDDVRTLWRCSMLAGPGLLVFGVTLHFAAIDWLMSLQTHFTSTMNGPLLFSSQLLSSYALSVLVFCVLLTRPEYREVLSAKAMNDLGSLLFTFLNLWAYMVWFQFMLIWMADLPHGTVWYLPRFRGVWNGLAVAIVVVQFVIPFFLLLLRAVKRNRALLGAVAGLTVFMQLLFSYWQVMPAYNSPGLGRHWMDILNPVAVGGIWGACFLWNLRRRALLPRFDEVNYPRAMLLCGLDEEETEREEALAHA